jgi:hypothetical protein
VACTQTRTVVHSPTIKACCQGAELVVSGQISRAIASIRCAKNGIIVANRAQCVFAAIAAGASFARRCSRSLTFLRVLAIGFDLLL